MMKSPRRTCSPGSVSSSGKPSILNLSKLPSPTSCRRKVPPETRSASVAPTRNPSMQTLKASELSASVSMKNLCLKEYKALPPTAAARNLRALAKKRRELIQLQRTLIQQQNTYVDLYAQLRDLEMRSGVEPCKSIGEAQLLSVKGWSGHDLLLLVRNDAQPYGQLDVRGVIGPASLRELNTLLSKIPEEVLTMAADLMARRLEVLEYLRTKARVEINSHVTDWKCKNIQFDTDTKNLHKLVVDTTKNLETRVLHSLQIAKLPWRDRDLLIKKIERLQKQLSLSQNKQILSGASDTDNSGDKMMNDQNVGTDVSSHTKLIEKLNKERADSESLRNVVSSAEGMLRTARARIAMLERQLRDTRAQLNDSIRKQKETEQLVRKQVETNYR